MAQKLKLHVTRIIVSYQGQILETKHIYTLQKTKHIPYKDPSFYNSINSHIPPATEYINGRTQH
jgi:hypothetical protein